MKAFLLISLLIIECVTATYEQTTLPKFLMDAYDCWTSADAGTAASCLQENSDYNLRDLNSIIMIKGTGNITSSNEFYRNSLKVSILPPSYTITFNHGEMPTENIGYGFIKIAKMAISKEVAKRINEQCNESLSLQLFWKVSANDHIYTLLSSAMLSTSEIGQSMDVEFKGVTTQLKEWRESERDIDVRLIIGESNFCYGTFTLEDLGFEPINTANVVLFTMSSYLNRDPFINHVNVLTTLITDSRIKRNSDSGRDELGSGSGTEQNTCKLHSFTVNFTDINNRLGDDISILYPPSYLLNYCAGSCEEFSNSWFLTRHRYMQFLASKIYSDLPAPTPLCFPSRLKSLEFLASIDRNGDTVFTIISWPEAIAISCECI